MEITPPRPPAPGVRHRSAASEDPSRTAQKEAQERAEEIHSQINALEKEGRSAVDHLKDEYTRQSSAESARDEAALESQKQKGYETVRQAQRAQAQELARLRREGEAELAHMREYYRNATYQTGSRGNQELQELEKRNALHLSFESRNGRDQLETIQKDEQLKLQQSQEARDRRLQGLSEEIRAQYGKDERSLDQGQ